MGYQQETKRLIEKNKKFLVILVGTPETIRERLIR